MKENGRMAVSVICAAVLFLLLFIGMNWDLIVAAAMAAGVYFGLYILLKPTRKIAGVDIETMPDGEEISRQLDEAKKDLDAVAKNVKQILNPQVREQAEKLHATGTKIMDYLNENPEKIRLARRFLTYYLDTSERLLSRYVEFQNTGVRTGEVSGILEKTQEALPMMNRAFDQQFTHLMEGELMDVDADIRLLNSTLKMEDGK